MMPPLTSAAYDPRTSSPPTYFDKFTPMLGSAAYAPNLVYKIIVTL